MSSIYHVFVHHFEIDKLIVKLILNPVFPDRIGRETKKKKKKKKSSSFPLQRATVVLSPLKFTFAFKWIGFWLAGKDPWLFFFFFGTATAEGIIWNSPWLRPRWKHGIFISIPFFRLTLAGLLALQTQLRYPLFQNNRLIRTRCVWVRGSIYACWDKKWTRQREIFCDCLRLTGI